MRVFRNISILIMIPLLMVAALASPVAAGSGKSTPKTNTEHPAWLDLDPVPETTDAEKIILAGKVAGKFTITITNGSFSKTFIKSGKFSVAVPLTEGENIIRLTGDNGHGRLLNQELRVVYEPKEIPAPSSLSLSLKGYLVADGESQATVTVAAKDANGRTSTGFHGPVTLESSDTAVVSVSQSTVNAVAGVARFSLLAGNTPGIATLVATTTGVPSATLSVTVAPVPDPGSTLAFDLFLSGTLQAHSDLQAELTAKVIDTLTGEVAADFAGEVSFVTSNPDSVLPLADSVLAENGVATVTLASGTSDAPATITVTASSIPAASLVVTPLPTELGSTALSLNGTLKVGDPTEASLTVRVLDATGQAVTDYSEPITLTSSDTNVVAVSQPSVAPERGVAAFTLSAGNSHGTVTLTVSAPGLPDNSMSVTVAQPDLRLDVSLSGTLQVGSSTAAILTISALNAEDQLYTAFTGPIWVSTSNPNVVQVSSTSVRAVDGIATVELTSWTLADTAEVTVGASGVSAVSIPVTVAPAPALDLGLALVVEGSLEAYSQSQATVMASVIDLNTGNVYGKYADAIAFSSSNPNSARLLSNSVIPINGVATAAAISGTSHSPATITVTAPGIPSSSVTITPFPPGPARITLVVDGALVVGGQSEATVTATILDAAGQIAKNFTDPIDFTSSNPDAVRVTNDYVFPENGVATATLAPGTVAGTATITASAPGLPAATMVVTAEAAMAPHLNLRLNGELVANNQSTATLTVTVLDAQGDVDRGFANPITFASSNPEAVQVVSGTVVPSNGVATVLLKAGSVASPAEITGTAQSLEPSAITVTPAAQVPSHLTIIADPTFLYLGGNYKGVLHLALKDQTGTAMLQVSEALQIQLTSSNEYVAHFGDLQGALAVAMTTPTLGVTLFGGIEPGETMITGSAANANITTDSVSVRGDFVPSPDSLLVETAQVVVAGSSQIATIRILDAYGNPMSDPTASARVRVTRRNPNGTTEILGTIDVENGYGTLQLTSTVPGEYRLTAQSVGGWPLSPGETTYTVTEQ